MSKKLYCQLYYREKKPIYTKIKTKPPYLHINYCYECEL